jgi:vitamin B12 transporter
MNPRMLAGPIWLAAALSLPGIARSEEALLWPDAIDTVKVVARRPFPEECINLPRGFVQVVPLGPSIPASRDLGDLLDGVAGVEVRRLGGVGAVSLVSIRGSAPSQVEVLIDDTPLAAGPDGVANLSLLPAHLFTRVEVGRGPLASIDGGSGAGVIRLVAPERFDLPLSARAGVGSFGSRSFSAAGGLARGPVSFFLSGGTMAARGDYPYLDRGSTPFESADDRIVRRSNNALDQRDLLSRARFRPSGRADRFSVDYLVQALWRDSGVPGTESRQTHTVHDRFRRLLQSFGARGRSAAGLAWSFALRRQNEVDRYRNPGGEIGLGRADVRNRFLAQGINGGFGAPIPRCRTALRIDGSLLREQLDRDDLLSAIVEPGRPRNSRGLAVEAVSQPLGGRFDLFGSQRWTVAEERGARSVTLAVPRVGGSVAVGSGLSVRWGWGRFGRLPSFVERFGRGGVQVGNPSLRPERGSSRDLGAILRWPSAGGAVRMQIEAAGFQTRTEDAIVWIQNSQRTTRAQNLERTRVDGAELTVRWAVRPPVSGLRLEQLIAATLQDPRDDGPSTTYHGRRLPYIPRRKGMIETRIDVRSAHLVHRLDHESAFYRDRYNSPGKMRGARTLQEVEIGYAFMDGRIALNGSIQNATNQRADDVEGFPLPGRSLSFDVIYQPDAGRGD